MGITLILLGFHPQQELENPTKIKKEYIIIKRRDKKERDIPT